MATEETLKISVRLQDFASAQFSKLNATVKGFGTGAVGAFKTVTGAVFSLKGALAGLGVAFTIKGLTDLVKATANEADELRDLGIQLGTTTEFLSELKFAGSQAGFGIGELEVGLRTLGKNLGEVAATGGGPALKALQQLDKKTQDLLLSQAPLAEKFLATARAIRALPESERLFVTSKLFGRGGGTFLQLFAEDLDKATAKARELGLSISGPAAAGADKFNDALGELSGALKGLRNQVILPLLPELTKLSNAITEGIVANRPQIVAFFADVVQGAGAFAQSISNVVASLEESLGGLTKFGARAAFAKQLLLDLPSDLVTGLFKSQQEFESGLKKIGERSNQLVDEIFANAEENGKRIRQLGKDAAEGAKSAADAIRGLGKPVVDLDAEFEEILRRIAEVPGEEVEASKGLIKSIRDRISATIEDGKQFVATGLTKLRSLEDQRILIDDLNRKEDKLFQKRLRQGQELFEAQQRFAGQRAEQLRQDQDEADALNRAQNAVSGLRNAFSTLREDAKEFGFAARDAVLGVADALAGNTTEALLDVIEGTKSAKKAFRDLAKQILIDIARIIISTIILKAVQGGLGGVGGLLLPTPSRNPGGVAFAAKGLVAPGPLRPVRGLAQGDVIRPPGALFAVAEAGRSEAVLPLARTRTGDLGVQTVGRGQQQAGPPSITVIQNFNGLVVGEKQLFQRNKEEIEAAIAAKYASSATYREQLRAA